MAVSPTDSNTFPRTAMYRKELLRGRVQWPGMTFQEKATWYVTQTHPLISISKAHPMHPLDRRERYIILGIDFAIRFAMSMGRAIHIKAARAAATVEELEELENTVVSDFEFSILIAVVSNVLHQLATYFGVLDDKCCAAEAETSTSRRAGTWLSQKLLKFLFGILFFVCLVLASVGSVLAIDPESMGYTILFSLLNSWTWMALLIAIPMFFVQLLFDNRADASLSKKEGMRLNISKDELLRWRSGNVDETLPLKVPTGDDNSGGEVIHVNPAAGARN